MLLKEQKPVAFEKKKKKKKTKQNTNYRLIFSPFTLIENN